MSTLTRVVAAPATELTIPGGTMFTLNGLRRGCFPDEEWLELRTQFVLDAGWMPQWSPDREYDGWDEDPLTTQLVCTMTGTIVAGMRLTQVADPASFMTARMFAARPAMVARVGARDQRELAEAAALGRLFDVTRFATRLMPTKATAALQQRCYPIMFGALVGHTVNLHPNDDSVWVFATTTNLLRYLVAIGVRPRVLTQSHVEDGTDYDDTIVCAIRPVQDFTEMIAASASRREQLVSEALRLGFDHARPMSQRA